MKTFGYLWRLQELDEDFRKYLIKYKETKQDRVLKELMNAENAARNIASKYSKKLGEMEVLLRKKNLEMDLLYEEIKNREKQLYDGHLHIKELEQMQNRISKEKDKKRLLEDEILSLMLEIEELKEKKEKEEKKAANIFEELQKYSKEKEDLINKLEKDIKKIREEMGKIVEGLSEEQLNCYKLLYEKKNRKPVALLQGNICTGCNMVLSSAFIEKISNPEIVYQCQFCGRIIGKEEWIQ